MNKRTNYLKTVINVRLVVEVNIGKTSLPSDFLIELSTKQLQLR